MFERRLREVKVVYPTFRFLYSYLEKQLAKKTDEGYRLTKLVGWCYHFEPSDDQLQDYFFYDSSLLGKLTGSEDIGIQVKLAYAPKKAQEHNCGFTYLIALNRDQVDDEIKKYRKERNKRCIVDSLEYGFSIMFLCFFPIYRMFAMQTISFWGIAAMILACFQIFSIGMNIIQLIKNR